ncbi:MAG: hypothetical protein V7K41_27845 [Nostoc sp.]|uniref:hypothetical protein n=1 Tax=Nostoc sp. TaxID=1180 RepID=UPI002FF70A8D
MSTEDNANQTELSISDRNTQIKRKKVVDMMAKNAEERYQSALGLKYDLETCLTQLQSTGKIESFPIAQTLHKQMCAIA